MREKRAARAGVRPLFGRAAHVHDADITSFVLDS
jgi:hypothetical protein